MSKIREIQWKFEGDCIRCTSHSSRSRYVKFRRNGGKMVSVPRAILIRRHGNNVDDMISRERNARSVFVPRENHYNAKLSETDVKEIKSSKWPTRIIANQYGVSLQAIYDIRQGRTWSHIHARRS